MRVTAASASAPISNVKLNVGVGVNAFDCRKRSKSAAQAKFYLMTFVPVFHTCEKERTHMNEFVAWF
eukprot:m.83914 g.83914  ORF g.83914 m.83914 type:complete len:67 (-) comp25687_c0_seq2:60-260(-)